ncbi:MAG: hypothetical protein H6730_20485 [Deltaproteobacteria bacterium]|nr:hypothetical protein [Deltaproteobacteria bacterium]
MANEIKNHVQRSLQQAKLGADALEQPGAHLLVPDDDGGLHVLVKRTEAHDAIEALAAEVRGAKGVKLQVSEGEDLDLGELGQWRDFLVDGLTDERLVDEARGFLELHVYSAAGKAVDPGEAFHTSMDLGFAIHEVISGRQLRVRPLPEGERDGQRFVAVGPELRKVMHKLMGRFVDHTVPVDSVMKAADAWRGLQNEVYEAGLVGAMTLGLMPKVPRVPLPDMPKDAPARGPGELSADLAAFLDARGMAPAGAPTAEWAEGALDHLPEDAPDDLVGELRQLYGHLLDAADAEAGALFGLDEPKGAPEVVHRGDKSLAASRKLKLDVLGKGLDGLEVPDKELRRLADLMAGGLQTRQRPEVVVIAGPRHSAADRMAELAVGMVGKEPLVLSRDDVAEPGFPALFGQFRGVPTGADGLLSASQVDAARDTPAAHAPIYLENVAAAGSADPEGQATAQADLLERLALMAESGEVSAYAREGGRMQEGKTSLANTLIVARWEGDRKELEALLARPELARLAGKVVGAEPMSPPAAVRYLQDRLTFDLERHLGPKGAKVRFSPELAQGLMSAAEARGAAAMHERFREPMLRELLDALRDQPLVEIELSFSRMLTKKDVANLVQDDLPPRAARWFGVRDGG